MISAGIDIGGTRVKLGLIKGRELLCQKVFDVTQSSSLALELPLIFEQLDQLIETSSIVDSIGSIGFAIPALVDSHQMKIISDYVKYSDAKDIDLQAVVFSRYGVKVAVENDARAALVGEYIFGAGQGYEDIVMVTLGTGIGSAVMLDGQLLRGRNYKAGNLAGHMTLDLDGLPCNCGDVGCAETVASGWVLEDRYKLLSDGAIPNPLNYQWVLSHRDNHEIANALWATLVKGWCHTLKNVVYAYDPECLLISGGIVNRGDVLLPEFQKYVDELPWKGQESIVVMPAKFPDWAGVMGAAWLALNQN